MASVCPHCGMTVEETVVISRVGMVWINVALLFWVTHTLTQVCHVHKSLETLNAGVAKSNNTVGAKEKAVTGESLFFTERSQ